MGPRLRCLLFALLPCWSRESFRNAEPKETTNRSPRSVIFFSQTKLFVDQIEKERGKEQRNRETMSPNERATRAKREREREGVGVLARALVSAGFRRDCKNNIWPTLS